MDARKPAELVEYLEEHGLEVYVDGGWAVDALLGEQTRPHGDLDIAVSHKFVPQLRDLLATLGYRQIARDDTWECNFVLADGQGRAPQGPNPVTLSTHHRHMHGPQPRGDDPRKHGMAAANQRESASAIPRHVVPGAAHRGEIGFESVEGQGSSFHFTLPLAP